VRKLQLNHTHGALQITT